MKTGNLQKSKSGTSSKKLRGIHISANQIIALALALAGSMAVVVTESAVADTVVCQISKAVGTGFVDGIERDRIGGTTEDQEIYNNEVGTPKVGMSDPQFFDENVLMVNVVNPFFYILNPYNLAEIRGEIEDLPGIYHDFGFVGKTDLTVGSEPDGSIRFFQLTNHSGQYQYIAKGITNSSGGGLVEYSGYIFITQLDDSLKLKLAAIPYDAIVNSASTDNLDSSKVEMEIGNGGINSGGAFFVDDSPMRDSPVDILVADYNLDSSSFGYWEIAVATSEDGSINAPETWMGQGKFKPTITKLIRGWLDKSSGDRIFETIDGGLYIEPLGFPPQEVDPSQFPLGIGDVTRLDGGGLYVVSKQEQQGAVPLIVRRNLDGIYVVSSAPDSPGDDSTIIRRCVAVPDEPEATPDVVEDAAQKDVIESETGLAGDVVGDEGIAMADNGYADASLDGVDTSDGDAAENEDLAECISDAGDGGWGTAETDTADELRPADVAEDAPDTQDSSIRLDVTVDKIEDSNLPPVEITDTDMNDFERGHGGSCSSAPASGTGTTGSVALMFAALIVLGLVRRRDAVRIMANVNCSDSNTISHASPNHEYSRRYRIYACRTTFESLCSLRVGLGRSRHH